MRHLRVRGGHQRGPCGADIRRRCRQRLVREAECLGGGGRGGDTGSFDRPCLVELLPRTVDRGLGPLDLSDVAFVGLHQVRERSELLTVPVERGDSARARPRMPHGPRPPRERRSPPRRPGRRRPARPRSERRRRLRPEGPPRSRSASPCGRPPTPRPLRRHPAPSPGARSPDRPIPMRAAVRATVRPSPVPPRGARAPRRSARALCRARQAPGRSASSRGFATRCASSNRS